MAIDRDHLSVSIIDESLKEEVFRADAGSQYNLEVALFCLPEILDHPDCGRYRQAVAKIFQRPGFKGSLHGPFFEMAYHSRDACVSEVVRKRMRAVLEIAADVKARFLVVHSTYNPLDRRPGYDEKWLERSLAFWHPIAQEAGKRGVTFVLENIFDDRPDMQKALVRKVDSPFFKACIDTGHIQVWGKCSQGEWIRTLGKDLAYLHIDNNQGQWDEHLAIDCGVIDFKEFFRTCEAEKVEAHFTVEVRRREDAASSVRFLSAQGFLR